VLLTRYVLLVGLSVVGCANRSHMSTANNVSTPAEDTKLGSGDLFEVRVVGQQDLTGKYKVGNDGTIQFPFLGVVSVGGKEPEEVARLLAAGLKDGGYLTEPQVTVLVEQTTSRRLSVLGAVARPGTLAIMSGMTVIEAISQAGGFTPLADKDGTVITRQVNGKLERYRVPVSDIARGAAADIPLRNGDIVFVPERIF
jgi:protein involved in polysaccharide export with SLBB domain